MIPILIICYNNYKYVDNTIKQLIKVNSSLEKDIIIINNSSHDIDTINYLESVKHKYKIIFTENKGPWVDDKRNRHIYDLMPDQYCLTDPDLEFNENLPHDFIQKLFMISQIYGSYKTGFALKIDDFDKMYQYNYYIDKNKTIYDIEKDFWLDFYKLKYETENPAYLAWIDTTFSLFDKKFINNPTNIRVAGNFTCRHLPFYVEENVLNIYDKYKYFLFDKKNTSTINRFFLRNLNENFVKIDKNGEKIFIKKVNKNIDFWNNFSNWDNDRYNVLDNYLCKNKYFIDIGSYLGATSIYASRKSKECYLLQNSANNISNVPFIKEYIKDNCDNIIFIENELLRLKQSETPETNNSETETKTESIVFYDIFYKFVNNSVRGNKNSIRISRDVISIINVDLCGKEEDLLLDLLHLHNNYKIPIYITFYCNLWKDKNINRFQHILNPYYIKKIQNNPQISILIDDLIIM